MKSLEEIKRKLEALNPILKRNFSVDAIEIFGSYVRGEQTEKSDTRYSGNILRAK